MTINHKLPVLAACFALTVSSGVSRGETVLSNAAKAVEMPFHNTLKETRTSDLGQLNAFSTDGCSGGLSESWKLVAKTFPNFEQAHTGRPPWENCCVTHDRAYHSAGPSPEPEDSFRARLFADRTLEACVRNTGEDRLEEIAARYNVEQEQVRQAYATIAGAMFAAVRFGGMPCSGLPWRWGYGYPACNALAKIKE